MTEWPRRAKLRLILPTVNVAIALAMILRALATAPRSLVFSSQVQGLLVLVEISEWLNAPATVLRNVMTRIIYVLPVRFEWSVQTAAFVYYGLFLVAVALIWYLVGCEIEEGIGIGRRAIVPSAPFLRVSIDVAFLVLGGYLLLLFMEPWTAWARQHFSGFLLTWDFLGYFLIYEFAYGAWVLFFVALYGRDLWNCFRESATPSATLDAEKHKFV